MKLREPDPEPRDVLFRIKRGLAAYVSYLAACEMNEAFSEYILYEPMLRILTARGFSVKCEAVCPGLPKAATGDSKKIDFEVSGHDLHFAIEVKWARKKRLDVRKDRVKLAAFHGHYPASRSFLCVFGRETHVKKISLNVNGFTERGKGAYADLRKTKFSCRIFEIPGRVN